MSSTGWRTHPPRSASSSPARTPASSSCAWRRSSRRQEIREHEAVTLDDLSADDLDGVAEPRGVERERVELASFTARVDGRRKILQVGAIELSTGERRLQLPRIDAGDAGADARVQHLGRERARVAQPEGEDRSDAGLGQPCLAVGPDVFEEQVAEDDLVDAFGPTPGETRRHAALVLVVRAR